MTDASTRGAAVHRNTPGLKCSFSAIHGRPWFRKIVVRCAAPDILPFGLLAERIGRMPNLPVRLKWSAHCTAPRKPGIPFKLRRPSAPARVVGASRRSLKWPAVPSREKDRRSGCDQDSPDNGRAKKRHGKVLFREPCYDAVVKTLLCSGLGTVDLGRVHDNDRIADLDLIEQFAGEFGGTPMQPWVAAPPERCCRDGHAIAGPGAAYTASEASYRLDRCSYPSTVPLAGRPASFSNPPRKGTTAVPISCPWRKTLSNCVLRSTRIEIGPSGTPSSFQTSRRMHLAVDSEERLGGSRKIPVGARLRLFPRTKEDPVLVSLGTCTFCCTASVHAERS